MGLSKSKLAYFKKKLIAEREAVLKHLRSDEDFKETLNSDSSPSDEADQVTTLNAQTFTYTMRRREMQKVREIDAALLRIEDGTYGVCEETGDPIEERRLEVQPWARVSLEVAREMETQRRKEGGDLAETGL